MTVRDSAKHTRPHHAAAALSRVAVVVVAAYIAAQMMADIASLKIGVVAGLAVDMGTFVYPVTFTLRDLVHKTLGKRNAQVLIIAAAVINLGMVLYLMWSAAVPSDPNSFGGAEFGAIFAPLWRIVCASILAELVSELVDTEIYHLFVSPRHRPFPVAARTGQQLGQRADRQPDFRPDRVFAGRLSRRAAGRLLGGSLGNLRLQSAGEVWSDAGDYASDLPDAGSGIGRVNQMNSPCQQQRRSIPRAWYTGSCLRPVCLIPRPPRPINSVKAENSARQESKSF